MDRLARYWFQSEARIKVLRLTATAFQDHFNDVMEAVHGSDFVRVRPAGKVGDRKCDGYHKPTDTVFQVYAPKRVVLREWLSKIDEDFAGAKAQWKSMRGWTFVHNDHDGLPPDVTMALLELRRVNPDLTIDQWSPQHLCSLTNDLTFEQLQPLFGYPPTDSDMRTLDRSDIAVAVAGLASKAQQWVPGPADLPTVDPQKIDFNKLTLHPRRLLTAGMTQAQMVDDYFANHPDPTLRDRTAMLMRVEWMRLQAEGTVGDAAFHALCDKALAPAAGSRQMSAALALLAYLFESCDIFDNPPSGWAGAVA